MKICSACERNLPTSEFGKNRAKKDGLQTQCKECRRGYQKEWYSENQEVQAERIRRNRERYTEYYKAVVWGIISTTPCVDCGETNPLVLEFDHRDPEQKKFDIAASKGGRSMGIDSLEAELAKCDVVCANCHRIRTHKYFGSWRVEMAVDLVIGEHS